MHLVYGMHPEALGAGQWGFMVGLAVADTTQAALSAPRWVPSDRAPALQRLAATMPALVQGIAATGDPRPLSLLLAESRSVCRLPFLTAAAVVAHGPDVSVTLAPALER